MKIAIIKYNAGNLFSVDCALKRLGVEPVITNDKETLLSADKVIFPGVGEARTTMDYLKACHMDLLIKELKQPVLGICLGMQLLCRHSEEVWESSMRKSSDSSRPILKRKFLIWDGIHCHISAARSFKV